MGHYASEIDPRWGEPSPRDKMLAEIDDPEVKGLASALCLGFNLGAYLDHSSANLASSTAQAIDVLIKKRVKEALDLIA